MTETTKGNNKDFFNSTAFWTIVALVGGAIVSLFIWYISQQKRGLSYTYQSSPVVNSPSDVITLYFKNTPVSDVYITNVTMVNTGNQSIKRNEIISGININLGKNCIILNSNVVASEPSNAVESFKKDLTYNSSNVEFKPSLLNAGDKVTLRVISSSCSPSGISLVGRIDGVKEIKLNRSSGEVNNLAVASVLFALTAMIGALLSVFFSFKYEQNIALKELAYIYDEINALKNNGETLEGAPLSSKLYQLYGRAERVSSKIDRIKRRRTLYLQVLSFFVPISLVTVAALIVSPF